MEILSPTSTESTAAMRSNARNAVDVEEGEYDGRRRDSRSRSRRRRRRRSYSRSRSRSRSRSYDRHRDRRRRDDRRRSRSRTKRPRLVQDVPFRETDHERAAERARQYPSEDVQPRRVPVDPAEEQQRMQLTTRSGGTYIPPARLRMMQAQIQDKSGEAFQRMTWEALKKSINGLINKVNMSNLKNIVIEMFGENLVRGRGIFARSMLKAQHASPTFTPVYAATVAVVNTKLPAVGALLLSRLISGFQRAFRRNDKAQCLSTTKLIGHLVNQQVAHEIVALQILALLLERPTDDSVEIAVGFMREVGAFLTEVSPKATHATFERFRAILNDSQIDKRVQYMIEVLFQIRKDKFKDNPIKPEELDIVEEDDQITHFIALDDELDLEESADVFKADPDYEANEQKYKEIKDEILGESSDEESGDDGGDEQEYGDEEEDEDEEGNQREQAIQKMQNEMVIQDKTETNLVHLRRTIYLTIMSSLDYEEACHKLLKLKLAEGQQQVMASMIVECCSQERTYEKFYGLIGERFCKLNRIWADSFCEEFIEKVCPHRHYIF